jgi:hypothetical protein
MKRNPQSDLSYLYCVEKKTIREISRIVKLSVWSTHKRLKQLGVSMRPGRPEKFTIPEDLKYLYLHEKFTQHQLAIRFHVSQRQIGRWLETLKVKSRFNNTIGGEFHSRWKGGVIKKNGRIFVYCPWHPRASRKKRGKGGYVKRSILVWEAYNGPVPPGHIIHHKNEIKTDDLIENLELKTNSDHSRYHRKMQSKRGILP